MKLVETKLGEDDLRDVAVVLRAFHAATRHGGCNVNRINDAIREGVTPDRVAQLAEAVEDAYLEPARRTG